MKNIEKYFDKLKVVGLDFTITLDNKIVDCNDIEECCDCKFDTARDCNITRLEWLNAEYVEPKPELSHFSKEYLKRLLAEGYEYLARDRNGRLYCFTVKPIKHSKDWFTDDTDIMDFDIVYKSFDEFPFVKWENDEPTKIADLIGDDDE